MKDDLPRCEIDRQAHEVAMKQAIRNIFRRLLFLPVKRTAAEAYIATLDELSHEANRS